MGLDELIIVYYNYLLCMTKSSLYWCYKVLVSVSAISCRSLRVDAIVDPIPLFAEDSVRMSIQCPDILLRNPRGSGRQIILDAL